LAARSSADVSIGSRAADRPWRKAAALLYGSAQSTFCYLKQLEIDVTTISAEAELNARTDSGAADLSSHPGLRFVYFFARRRTGTRGIYSF